MVPFIFRSARDRAIREPVSSGVRLMTFRTIDGSPALAHARIANLLAYIESIQKVALK